MAEYKRKELGERIRAARKQRGMTQSTLAERSGLSIQHISNIENARTDVSVGSIVAIANALSVSADRLLCDSLTVGTTVLAGDISTLLQNCSSDDLYAIFKILGTSKDIVQSKIHKDSTL